MTNDEAIRAFLDFSKDQVNETIESALFLLYEQQATLLGISIDYFIQEFVVS